MGFDERGYGRAEKRLMYVLQLVLFVRESVCIIHHMVHTLVWLEVEIEALDCPQHLIWCSSWIDRELPKSYCLISASREDPNFLP